MDIQTLASTVEGKIKQQFGDALLKTEMHYDFPVYYINSQQIIEVLRFLKEDPELNFYFLTTLTGLHYPDQKGEELGVMYQLHNLTQNWRIRLKAFVPIENPVIGTATVLWNAANWLERETFDFFGIQFSGHPNLKRILNMDEMNYHPLRKEYPLEDLSREDKNDTMFGR